jgi:hypothetical protein
MRRSYSSVPTLARRTSARRWRGCWSDCRGSGRLAKPYPAPTESQVPALAINTTVAMKITASIRDKVHALGIGNGLRSDSLGCG